MIIAHGPLWSEWHHVLPYLTALPLVGIFVAQMRSRFKK